MHYPESVDELMSVITRKMAGNEGAFGNSYGSGVILLIKNALMLTNTMFLMKIFLMIFWLPFLIVMIAAIILLLKDGRELLNIDRINILMTSLFFASIVVIMLDKNGYYWYLMITIPFTLLFFSLLLTFKRPLIDEIFSIKDIKSILIIVSICVFISTNLLLNLARYSFLSPNYFSVTKTYKVVSENLKSGDNLFLYHKQIGTFIDLFDSLYRGDANIMVYDIFPQTYLYNKGDRLKYFMKKKIKRVPAEKMIWSVPLFFSQTLDGKELKFFSANTEFIYLASCAIEPITLKFGIKDIIYKDDEYLFFRPSYVEMIENE
ncbi:MAG: hypothetical protein HQK93_05120 [Nitrospirae bacterium]|nr:hypothetical protein [Nitrospirota bacterium]